MEMIPAPQIGDRSETQEAVTVERPEQEEAAVGIVSSVAEGDDVVMVDVEAGKTGPPVETSSSTAVSQIPLSAPIPPPAPVPSVVTSTTTSLPVATTSTALASGPSQFPLDIPAIPSLQAPISGLSVPQWGQLVMLCLSPDDRELFPHHRSAAVPQERVDRAAMEARKLLSQCGSSGDLNRLFEMARASHSHGGRPSGASSATVTPRSSPPQPPGRSLAQPHSSTQPHSQDQRSHGTQPQHHRPPQSHTQTQTQPQPQPQPVPVRPVQMPLQSGDVTVRVNPQFAAGQQQQHQHQQQQQQQRSLPHQQARPLQQQLVRPQQVQVQSQPRSQPQVHAQAHAQVHGQGHFRVRPPPLAIQHMSAGANVPYLPSGIVVVQPVHYVSPGGTVRPAPAPAPLPRAPAPTRLPTPVQPVGSARIPTPMHPTSTSALVTATATASSGEVSAAVTAAVTVAPSVAAANRIDQLWSTGMEQVSQRMQESW
jgi:hypothetical protein